MNLIFLLLIYKFLYIYLSVLLKIYNENNNMSDLEELNPYEVLKVKPTSNKYECK